jgi:hypothetical protein
LFCLFSEPRLLGRVAPMVAISFTVFDTSKKVTREVFGIELRE